MMMIHSLRSAGLASLTLMVQRPSRFASRTTRPYVNVTKAIQFCRNLSSHFTTESMISLALSFIMLPQGTLLKSSYHRTGGLLQMSRHPRPILFLALPIMGLAGLVLCASYAYSPGVTIDFHWFLVPLSAWLGYRWGQAGMWSAA